MAKKSTQSVEPNIADLANGWLKSYKLAYKLEQESLNTEIDKALDDYFSKSGGTGGNRPDTKLLLQDSKLNFYPILIEYKGYKDKLVKLDENGKLKTQQPKMSQFLSTSILMLSMVLFIMQMPFYITQAIPISLPSVLLDIKMTSAYYNIK